MKTDTPLRETPQSITVMTDRPHGRSGRDECSGCPALYPGRLRRRLWRGPRAATIRASVVRTPISISTVRARRTSIRFNEWRPDPYTAERIEVMRGRRPYCMATRRWPGLINLISKRPAGRRLRARSAFSSTVSDRKQVQLDTTGKLTKDGEWLYRFVGVFRDSNMQTDFTQG